MASQALNLKVVNPLLGDTLYLHWDDVPDDVAFTTYEIHRATALNGTYSLLASTGLNLYYDTTAYEGDRYSWYYKVRAVYGATYGDFSDAQTWSTFDYGNFKNILKELIRRKQWMLTKGEGQAAQFFVKKTRGAYCDCSGLRRAGGPARKECQICWGTGLVGGYEVQYSGRIGRDASLIHLQGTEHGLVAQRAETWWTLGTPTLRTGDFLVTGNNDRFRVGSITPYLSWRGNVIWQSFSLDLINDKDPLYLFPVVLAATPC